MIFVPGGAASLFILVEMPKNIKRVFYKIPAWLSSSAISIGIGILGRGVLGPMTGFMSELVLFPSIYIGKKIFDIQERRAEENGIGKRMGNEETA